MSISVVRAGGSVIAETPIGAIQGYAGTAAPTGWLLCDGTAVSRSTYSELFGVVSTTYGSGDGSTTFNLPNITGYIIYATRLSTRVTLNNPPEFVTALPSSPLDGKEIYYQADGTNGVIWHLRYRSGSSSSYKWEFVGGSEMWADVATEQGTASTTFTDLSTVGPSITTPLAGDYVVSVSARMANNQNGGECQMSFAIGGTAASQDDGVRYYAATSLNTVAGATLASQFSREVTKTALAASTALTSKYRGSVGTATFGYRRISLRPVRVG